MNETKIPFSRTRKLCEEEGIFSLAIIAPPAELDPTGLDNLLSDGVGDMQFLAEHRELLLHPAQMLPGCRAIIVASIAYSPEQSKGKFRRARYAAGKDYHRIIRKKLSKIGSRLLDENGDSYPSRATTDSAPVMERTLAKTAGLGWHGKNGLLIHPQRGSYSFLGLLFTAAPLELVAENHAKDRCGSCSKCLAACPTGALQDGRVISQRCISYLTIEHKGVISKSLAQKFSGFWFGCDLCQEACPWNARFAIAAEDDRFQAAGDIDLLSITAEQFDSVFAGSAVRRLGFERFQRNLLISCWNLQQMDQCHKIISRQLPIVIAQADELDLPLPL
jgi:epoxyqueuosine reductase